MLSAQAKRALDVGLANLDSSNEIEALLSGATRNIYFVNTDTGSDTGYNGQSWRTPFATVTAALAVAGDEDTILVAGNIREHCTAPLGVYGVKLIGAVSGRPRQGTSNGVVLGGNGVYWRDTAVSVSAPLLKLREQGWEVRNFFFVPKAGYAAVRLDRQESATYPDASHCIIADNYFMSPDGIAGKTGYGIEDNGQNYDVGSFRNLFYGLEYAYKVDTSAGIAAPQLHTWADCTFRGCKTDIAGNFAHSHFLRNRHLTPYNGSTHPTTLNLASTSDAGSAVDPNFVEDVRFADAAADVQTIAKGYKAATGDLWRYRAADSTADVVTKPS